MQTLVNIIAAIILVVAACSVIAMITPTPKPESLLGKIYKYTVDLGALNFWKAKDKSCHLLQT